MSIVIRPLPLPASKRERLDLRRAMHEHERWHRAHTVKHPFITGWGLYATEDFADRQYARQRRPESHIHRMARLGQLPIRVDQRTYSRYQ